ncbi:DUF3533 domain-containing protein [Nocardia panacis]|uniref:DUF3533 domain-containing protein n=1 Tax=Nocardia panacis TaxID=2340916 RepID=A0A3A4KGJ4_9NOCA|nr:ABC transporter permease [Nocardia panacis]RJO78444.1 DUF3533 domain-containing protein [Nocardia panacis]
MTTADSGNEGGGRRLPAKAWLAPMVVIALLMSLLATMYLAYVVDPAKHLHEFPIALVDQDQGDVIGGKPTNLGEQIADGLTKQVPAEKVALRPMGIGQAQRELGDGKLYGAIVIPADFTKRVGIFATASVVPGDVQQPIITVYTNPRAGSFAVSLVQTITGQALSKVNQTVGAQLTDQVKGQTQGQELVGLSRLLLAKPIDVVVTPYHPLPAGTGGGLVAFFYTVMVLLAGFTGAVVITSMVDSSLGFAPTEFGPWYAHFPRAPISRLRTLLMKWAIMAVMAPVVSGIYMGVARWLGMPIDRPLALFLYSTLAIVAVGVTALSIVAAFGTAGLLVNLVLFIVLGLPSSGGTIPVEAVPRGVAWLSGFEPMHQVFLGLRSILFFDASGAAGLSRALWMTLLGLAIGLVLGAVVTKFYDYKGLHRKPVQV